MSGKNAPIQIPSELNVPDDEDDDDNITAPSDIQKPIQDLSKSSIDVKAKSLPMHRLKSTSKSRSMYNIVTVSNDTSTDQSDENGPHEEHNQPPEITLSPPSAKYQNYNQNKSTVSLDRAIEDRLMGDPVENLHNKSLNEFSERNKRANSIAHSELSHRESGEFDELKPNQNPAGSQLRIRSSIISLFGRMGRARRGSNLSQNSSGGNDGDHAPPLRALPQIAATKILRAFSYVGKDL